PEQRWAELYGLIRLCRNLRLFEPARKFLASAQQVMQDLGLYGQYRHRLATIELGLRLHEFAAKPDLEEILQLVSDLQENCATVAENKETLVLAFSFLAQLLGLREWQ